MCRFKQSVIIILLSVFALSCSGGSGNPVTPGQPDLTSIQVTADSDSTQIWGLWQVEFDPGTDEFHAVPLRGAEFACNVIKFINGPPPNLIISLISAVPYPTHRDFILDIGFSHPFPGLDRYTGFDVMGVFMGNGSAFYPGNGMYPVQGPLDQRLLNPDGYTRRFNATEFFGAGEILPLQGYYPGNNGPPGYVPTAVLNPYKYYSNVTLPTGNAFDLLKADPESRGAFLPGSVNYRRFHVRFPNSTGIQFQYAVIANWDVNVNHPDPPGSLDDFPISCNSQEAVVIDIVDSSDAYFENITTYGGDIILDVTPWDWSASTISGVMEEYELRAYSSAWSGAYDLDMIPTSEGEYWNTFHAEIPVEILTHSGFLPVWIELMYPYFDYTSPVGVPNDATGNLASYFLTEVEIEDHGQQTGNGFIYSIADVECVNENYFGGNLLFFENLLSMPSDGPYADNMIVKYYEGHSTGYWVYPQAFHDHIESLGYAFDFEAADSAGPLNADGLKMLLIALFFPTTPQELFTPEEVQEIRNLVQGGGVCILITDHKYCYQSGTDWMDQLLIDLDAQFTVPHDFYMSAPWTATDISPDPSTQGVTDFNGDCHGYYNVFGDGLSLIRFSEGRTVVVKSPIN